MILPVARDRIISIDDEDEIVVGELILRPGSFEVSWRAMRVHLTLIEFRIVQVLAMAGGGYKSYRDVYDLVHGAGFVAGKGPHGIAVNVRAIIMRMRLKFKSVDPDFERIQNYRRYGYRWQTA